MRLLIALLLCSLAWGGTAYTSNAAAGTWNVATDWTPEGIPGDTDTVKIANGHTMTIPVGYTATIGASPADDTATAAIACASSTGTGILNIRGTLIWRGSVRQCNATWTAYPGSTISYDGASSGAYYTWQVGAANDQANALMVFAGTDGAHVTVNSIGGVYQSGGWGNVAAGMNYTGGGRVTAAYTDFSNQGKDSVLTNFWRSRLSSAGYQSTWDHCTITSCAMLNIMEAADGAIFYFKNSSYTAPKETSQSYSIYFKATADITTGERLVQDSVISQHFYIDSSTVKTSGLSFKNVLFQKDYTSTRQAFEASTLGASVAAWEQVFIHLAMSDDRSIRIPSGHLYSSFFYHAMNPSLGNPHPMYLNPLIADTFLDGWVFQYSNDDDDGDWLQSDDDTTGATRHVGIVNTIAIPGSTGIAIGNYLNANTGDTATDNFYSLNHNTLPISGSASVTYGLGAEGASTAIPAGGFEGAKGNIAWRRASGVGKLTQASAAGALTNGSYDSADYNTTYNLTGTIYGHADANYQNPSPPGSHDTVGVNPRFVDTYRSLYTFDRLYLGYAIATAWAVSTDYVAGDIRSDYQAGFYENLIVNWRCTQSHNSGDGSASRPGSGSTWLAYWEPASVQRIKDRVLAGSRYVDGAIGGTASDGVVGALVKWVRRGFMPTNMALRGVADGGTDPGAVALDRWQPVMGWINQ